MDIRQGNVFMNRLAIITLTLSLFLQDGCVAGTIETSVTPQDCYRIPRVCWYPDACECQTRLGFGAWIRGMWHYSYVTNTCRRGGEAFNCNAFLSRLQCERACR
uniref:Pancreatic trypsin inhibitor n=1 Tax=Rhipicephalus appendiculatus TaxID=34631 RepID=A0A131YXM0_RHIAP